MPAVIGLALLLYGFAPLVTTAADAARNHRVFTGAAGYFPWDQLQYLGFVSDAHFGLIRNLFGLTGGGVFVDPVWSPSGIVHNAFGVGFVPIVIFWTLVAAGVLFAGAWRLVAWHIPADAPMRRAGALVLALFGGVTVLAEVPSPGNGTWLAGNALDLIPAQGLWGYAPIAIAVGLMPFVIGGMEQILASRASRKTVLMTALGCVVVGWLHPWQAGTLALIWAGLLAWRLRDALASLPRPIQVRRAIHSLGPLRAILLISGSLVSAPLYYELLSRIDYSWSQFNAADGSRFWISTTYFEFVLLPLAVVALLGMVAARRDRDARALVLWPLMTLILFAVRPPEPFHALDGVALPVGVLLMRAWPDVRGGRLTRWGILGYVAFVGVSAAVIGVQLGGFTVARTNVPYTELNPADVRAAAVAASHSGAQPILTTAAIGAAIPALADRPVWVGNLFWTPDAFTRANKVGALFGGQFDPGKERRFVASTGTLAILQPCDSPVDLESGLRPLGFREDQIGCARVLWRLAAA